jgi:omega-amidase
MSALSMSSSVHSKVTLGLCQISVGANKEKNIETAVSALKKASSLGADMVVLPECWNSPYATSSFPVYAEPVPPVGVLPDKVENPSSSALCATAKELGVWLVGGSIPERSGEQLFNTCLVINPSGSICAKHRKVHLFDIDVPGKIRFIESDSLTGGDSATVIDTPWGGLGVGICYDIRFPELGIVMRQRGARIIVYPGAFNMVTGPAHWELLQRARAVDNQVYVATCSPARDESSGGYVAWGHSTVVNPWGEVIAKADKGDEIVLVDLDLDKIDEVRENIPCWKQKREDLYSTVSKL